MREAVIISHPFLIFCFHKFSNFTPSVLSICCALVSTQINLDPRTKAVTYVMQHLPSGCILWFIIWFRGGYTCTMRFYWVFFISYQIGRLTPVTVHFHVISSVSTHFPFPCLTALDTGKYKDEGTELNWTERGSFWNIGFLRTFLREEYIIHYTHHPLHPIDISRIIDVDIQLSHLQALSAALQRDLVLGSAYSNPFNDVWGVLWGFPYCLTNIDTDREFFEKFSFFGKH